MPDLFQPDDFTDGQLVTAAHLDKISLGIEALDVELDRVGDAVADLQANGGGGGGTSGQVQSGPRASFSPSIGLILLDTSLTPARFIGGYGTEWRNLDGTAITTTPGGGGGSEPGTSTAPANMTFTVTAGGTIGQINMSWSPVPGATFYTLYESASPTGVAGSTALTTTSVSRTPGTARNYDYWVTATVGGVESAASNHVFPVLPYVAPGGGGGTPSTDPSTFLNINGKGTGTGGWWNLGHGVPGGSHVDITPTQLQNNYVNSPHYVMNATGTGVQMQTFMNSGTTSGSSYPREELREYATGSTSTKAAWSGSSGRHIMRGRTRVMHYAPTKCEVVVGQMHDGSDDTLQIRAEASSATGSQTWRLSVNGTEVDDLITGVALGQEVQWEIDCNNGNLTVRINGAVAYGPTNPGYGAGQYFKIGCYAQQSTAQGNASSEYTRIELRDLFVSHS